ncbi:MAG: DUF6067 family protein [Candidatus Omnitrophica bacterium]|nr:DUF6067 family protein [Candidatus Omnitrophota bacterium]MCM8803413.1 DUF6067 family protein [Candidatus Omnitrophota bacterium]
MKIILIFILLFNVFSFTETNLLLDPSIEEIIPKNQFGIPYAKWSGWIFEGIAEFRNGKIARNGNTSAEMLNGLNSKIRLYTPKMKLTPGKYKFSFYVRGIDIQKRWGTTLDLNFIDNTYHKIPLEGDFDWTKVEIVKEVEKEGEYQGRIGMIGPGRVWIDDAEVIKLNNNLLVTPEPIVEKVKQIKRPGEIKNPVRCKDCGYLNDEKWEKCYICGELLKEEKREVPNKLLLESFEKGRGIFSLEGLGEVVKENVTDGEYSLLIKSGYAVINYKKENLGDWSSFDFLKIDMISKNEEPVDLYVEIRDIATKDYWTRVNIYTVVLPGFSTFILPLKNLYVGEKSRPGRPLDLKGITRFVIAPAKSIYIDNVRLEKDLSIEKIKIPNLFAFDFTPKLSSYMPGFITVSPLILYKPERGFGFTKPNIWKGFDFLQPDPLYQTALCIVDGGEFRIDLPNGKYRVFMNIDSPSGYWGEYQVYRERMVRINGKDVLWEKMDFNQFLKKYFRWASIDDYIEENTFDKYINSYFNEKKFDVEVNDGKMLIQFFGQNWANTLSTIIIYPLQYSDLGEQYLANLKERRRFYFDNYFRKIIPNPKKDRKGEIPEFIPTDEEKKKGYVVFTRDWMEDIYQNSVPRREEITENIEIFATIGEKEPIVFSIYPFEDLGNVKISVTDLKSSNGIVISKENIEIGVVSHRITRVTSEGTVYTISPRLILLKDEIDLKKQITTTIWLTLKVPENINGDFYNGKIKLTFINQQKEEDLNLKVKVFPYKLDEVDIPAGPFGCKIPMPWFKEDIPDYEIEMYEKSLKKLREYGFTVFSGIPKILLEIKDGKLEIDFKLADKEMELAKKLGFKIVCNYGASLTLEGKNLQRGLYPELAEKLGFKDYKELLKYILTKIEKHVVEKDYLPIIISLYDEPAGKEAKERITEYSSLWKEITKGMNKVKTTGYTSLNSSSIQDNVQVSLVSSVDIVSLNIHDEKAIEKIEEKGVDWAFYNSGNRWTYGIYLFKLAKEKKLHHRITWHWNICAGDPYYALDCREDDYAWCVTNEKKELIPTISFIRIAEGLDDYKYLLTLSKMIKEKPNHPYALEAKKILDQILNSIVIGTRQYSGNYKELRYQLGVAIEKLIKEN